MAHDQTTLAPASLQANSMLPRMSEFSDIACHATVEYVADAEIHDGLGRSSRVDTAEQDRSRILTLGARALLSQEIIIFTLPGVKALVTRLHERQNIVRRQLVALRLGQRVSVRKRAERANPDETHRGDCTRGLEETAAWRWWGKWSVRRSWT